MVKIYKRIRLPLSIVKILVKDRMYYPDRLFFDAFLIISRYGVLLALYWYVFRLNGGNIKGITFPFAVWSIFFYFSFMLLQLRSIAKDIMQDVQTGNVEILFSKPISYVFYKMWWQLGSGLYSFFVINIFAITGLFFIVGIPFTMTLNIFLPTFFITFVFGILIALCTYSIIGLLAFWIEDINPVFWVVDKSVMILGGSFLPVAFFPSLMYKLATWSPFGALHFVTRTVYESWQVNWMQLVGIQMFWILFLGIVLFFLFKKAKQKVSVNGG